MILAAFLLDLLAHIDGLLLGFVLGSLNTLIDITKEEDIEQIVPLPLIASLLCLVGVGLHSFLDFTEILFALYFLILE